MSLVSRKFLSRVATNVLRQVEGSLLEPSATLNGAHFIDRDNDLFSYVVEYLPTDTVELPDSIEVLRRLQKEPDFFMLPDTETMIHSKLQKVHPQQPAW